MPDPTWPSSPPEVNYLRLVGPGAAGTATTVASGAIWQAVMAGDEIAFSVSTLNTELTAVNFEGVGGTNSAATITGLNAALQLLAGWAQEKPPIAASAVAAYDTAVSSMIPAEVSLANRTEQAANVALNPSVLGVLTPAIVALDAEYFGEHWPHNASTGAAYGAALAALTAALAVPPPLSPLGGSPAAPAAAAAAVAQSAGQAAAGEAMTQSTSMSKAVGDGSAVSAGMAGQAASAVAQPLQRALEPVMGMFAMPIQAFQGVAGLPQTLGGFDGFDSGGAELPASVLTGIGTPGAGSGAGAIGPVTSGAGGGFGAVPGAGLTSYTRPAQAFGQENSGRPTALKANPLSAADFRGPTTTGMGGGAVPVSPGAVQGGKNTDDKGSITHARVIVGSGRPSPSRTS